jgi:hypothetical protein
MIDETSIANALIAATTAALTGIGFTDAAHQIAWPDVGYQVADKPTRYIEVLHFRNSTVGPNWGEEKEFTGIWQISVIDFTQEGEIPALVICSQIADTFHKDAVFWNADTKVLITDPPTALTVVLEGHKATYPVSIRYRCSG